MQSILSAARAKRLDRVAAAYAVAGWLLVQASSIVLPTFGTPAWALRTIIAIAFIGFPVALFIAWFSIPHPHPETLPKREGLTPGEYMLLGLLGGVLVLSLSQLGYQFLARAPSASSGARATLGNSNATSAAPTSLRVAIIPFDVVGAESDATRAFADTLLDKIVEVLAANQVDTVSRADALTLRGGTQKANAALIDLGVGMTLEGSVQSDGKTIMVRLHLDDVQHHQTLWSKEFRGPADSPEPLQTQVAFHATDVTRWAVSPRLKEIRSDPSLVAEYLEGEDEQINGDGGRALTIARDLASRAPRFAAAHTLLASAVGQEGGTRVATPEERAESTREAKVAIALDNSDGQAYAMLSSNLPALAFKEREELLIKGLAVEPGNASANSDYITQLLTTGRIEEAVTQARTAWQLAPFTEWVAWSLPLTLATAGRIDEARGALAEMKRKWPENPDPYFLSAEFVVESQKPPFARALALLDDPKLQQIYERPLLGKPGAVDVLRTVLHARLGSSEDRRKATQLVEDSTETGIINPFSGVTILAVLGDIDRAFRAADRTLTAKKIHDFVGGIGPYYLLFSNLTLELRRDSRFMQLAQRLELVDYWRSTGHWPDFCSEPGLPYDCKAVAAKLAATSVRR